HCTAGPDARIVRLRAGRVAMTWRRRFAKSGHRRGDEHGEFDGRRLPGHRRRRQQQQFVGRGSGQRRRDREQVASRPADRRGDEARREDRERQGARVPHAAAAFVQVRKLADPATDSCAPGARAKECGRIDGARFRRHRAAMRPRTPLRASSAMDFAFVLDPLPLLKAYKDTSIAMMRALDARGHRIWALAQSDIYWRDGATRARARLLTLSADDHHWYDEVEVQDRALT